MDCRIATLIIWAIIFAVPQVVAAEELGDRHPYLENGFSLDLGIFYPDRQLSLQVNGALGRINREIDFDEGLRLKRGDDTFSGELTWRFRDGWSINSPISALT